MVASVPCDFEEEEGEEEGEQGEQEGEQEGEEALSDAARRTTSGPRDTQQR